MEGLSTIVKAKATANKAAIKLRLNEVEREKLEQYQKQDKLNAKEAKLKKDFLAISESILCLYIRKLKERHSKLVFQ